MDELQEIPGHEGFYSVSKDGKIWSYPCRLHGGIFLKCKIDKDGYERVVLRKNGKLNDLSIHRIVAITYLPNPENKPFVNHKDGNKRNNAISNLEWCTAKENTRHCMETLGTFPNKEHYQKIGEMTSKKIGKYDKKGNLLKIYNSIRDASKENGLFHGTISACALNKKYRHTHGGYSWKFINN